MEREAAKEEHSLGALVGGIVDDLKTIARDEAILAKHEIGKSLKVAGADASAILLGGIVALIGLGMLSTAGVVALDALIPSLAVRLVVMAAVYMIAGGVVAAVFVRRLKTDVQPDLTVPAHLARSTMATAKEALRHG